jgi:acetyl-CoA carboxylase biotin carboxyl carrier protein
LEIDRNDVREIVSAITASAVDEFDLEVGDFKLRVRRRTPAPQGERGPETAGESRPPTPVSSSPAPGVEPPRPAASAGMPARDGTVAVMAPLIGTFYRAPAPDEPPFVELGSTVEPEDTVCIVEVMKLMNAVRAGCRGRVVEICAENGALVEYGQALMLIEPAA